MNDEQRVMQQKIRLFLSGMVKVLLAFLPVPLLIRGAEIVYLSSAYPFTVEAFLLECSGFGIDYLYLLAFTLFFLPVGVLISLRYPKSATRILFGLLLLLTLVWFSLVKYFITTLIPLDQVLFAYTFEEIIKIVLSSTTFDPIGLIVYILLIAMPFLMLFLLRKWSPKGLILWLCIMAGMMAMIVLPFVQPNRSNYPRDFDYYMTVNKLDYALEKCTHYLITNLRDHSETVILEKGEGIAMSPELYQASRNYQHANPDLDYYTPEFPFLRKDQTKNILTGIKPPGDQLPNLVFIIVESLTPSFCGEHPWFGQYMPFLDSLRRQGYYWENCLSTSERTFNVLPGVFASLPYAHGEFVYDKMEKTNHFSLISLLKDAGYFSTFYYGGDPGYTNYGPFLTREGLSLVVDMDAPRFEDIVMEEGTWWSWGFPDGDLYEQAALILDTLQQSPRLDIFLTLSMHAPFEPPDADYWNKQVEIRLDQPGVTAEQREATLKMKPVFASILYSDAMLRDFFAEMKKRSDFDHTLFVITGDHAMPELHTSHRNLLEKFHVPLILFSPMITQPASFPDIVTHLDITPSIVAWLQDLGVLEQIPYCHWLGRGLSMNAPKDKPVEITFAFNNMEEPEMLKNQYFLSYDKLFERSEGLNIAMIEDPGMRDSIQTLHQNYLDLSRFVVARNAVMPDDLYFKETFHQERLAIDSALRFAPGSNSWEFISLMSFIPLTRPYQYVDVDLELNISGVPKENPDLPVLVVEVKDSSMNSLYYSYFHLKKTGVKPASTGIPDTGQTLSRYRLFERIDIGFIPQNTDKLLKMYFWNRNKRELTMDSLSFDLSGYFRPQFSQINQSP